MKSIGIDIGTSAVRFVEVEATPRGLIFRRAQEFLLNPDPAIDNQVQVLEALRTIVATKDPAARTVISVSQNNVTARHKIFPFRERQKILKSLPFELEDEIPFTQDTAIFDAKFQGTRGNAAHVLALACPKKAVQEVLKRAQDAGLEPDLISMEASALSSLDENWDDSPPELPHRDLNEEDTQQGTILLHIGHNHSVFCVMHRGTLLYTRSIQVGGVHIIRSIQKKYNIPFPEAAKATMERAFVLTSHDKASPEQLSFSETVAGVMKDLIIELRRSILDVTSEFKIKLGSVEITGGVSRLINLGPYLTQELELPCNPRSPFRRWDKAYLGLDDKTDLNFGVAAGLAIEGARRPKNPAVNFRRNELSRESKGAKALIERWAPTAKAMGLVLVALFVYSFLRESWTTTLSISANAALKKKALASNLPKNQTSPAAVIKYIRQEEKKVETQKTLSKLQNLNSPLDLMKEISASLPPKELIQLDVRRFYIINEFLTIEGEVSSPNHVALVKNALQRTSSDNQVQELKPSFQAASKRPSFAYSIRVRRQGTNL